MSGSETYGEYYEGYPVPNDSEMDRVAQEWVSLPRPKTLVTTTEEILDPIWQEFDEIEQSNQPSVFERFCNLAMNDMVVAALSREVYSSFDDDIVSNAMWGGFMNGLGTSILVENMRGNEAISNNNFSSMILSWFSYELQSQAYRDEAIGKLDAVRSMSVSMDEFLTDWLTKEEEVLVNHGADESQAKKFASNLVYGAGVAVELVTLQHRFNSIT